MNDISQVYQAITGRAPSDDTISRVRRIASALGVSDNDAFLSLIMIEEVYSQNFRRSLKQTEQAAETLKQALETVKASQEEVKGFWRRIGKMWPWLCGLVLAVILSLVAVGYFSFKAGVDVGFERGVTSAVHKQAMQGNLRRFLPLFGLPLEIID